jgi:hypothetical protein
MAADAGSDLEYLAATALRSIGDLRSAVEAVPVGPRQRGGAFRGVINDGIGCET